MKKRVMVPSAAAIAALAVLTCRIPTAWAAEMAPAAVAPTGAGQNTAAVRVWMTAQPKRPAVGRRLVLSVSASAGSGVTSVPFHVQYDPLVLRFERGTEGPFLKRGGLQTAFFASPTSSGDEVVVGLSQLGRSEGVKGQGLLCTLEFTVLRAGASDLRFTSAAVRGTGNDILPSKFTPASVKVGGGGGKH